jgi:HSP20 family molecular chaperone IbpA
VDVLADELRYFLEDGFKEVSAENRRGPTRPCSIVLEDDNGVHFDVDLAGVSPTDNDVSLLSPSTSLKLICIRAVRRDGASSKFDVIFPDGFEHKGHRIDISKIKRAAS